MTLYADLDGYLHFDRIVWSRCCYSIISLYLYFVRVINCLQQPNRVLWCKAIMLFSICKISPQHRWGLSIFNRKPEMGSNRNSLIDTKRLIKKLENVNEVVSLLTGVYGSVVVKKMQQLGKLDRASIKTIANERKLYINKISERLADLEERKLVTKESVQPVVYVMDLKGYSDLMERVKTLYRYGNPSVENGGILDDHQYAAYVVNMLRCIAGRALDIICILYDNGCLKNTEHYMSDAEIAEIIGLSKSSVSRNAAELEKYGILHRFTLNNKTATQLCRQEFSDILSGIYELDAVSDKYSIIDSYSAKYLYTRQGEDGKPERIRMPTKMMPIIRKKK